MTEKGGSSLDLPEKLEETRYARMEGWQQKLYDAEVAHIEKDAIAIRYEKY